MVVSAVAEYRYEDIHRSSDKTMSAETSLKDVYAGVTNISGQFRAISINVRKKFQIWA